MLALKANLSVQVPNASFQIVGNKMHVCIHALTARIQEFKSLNLKIGFTCGAFDLLHLGHLKMLKETKE